MKVVFMGTPDVAVPILNAIYNSRHEVVAVVSQPDKAKGRSNKIVPTPIKSLALEHGTPVLQFENIRKDDISSLLSLDADIIVTCAYGQILGEDVLNAFRFGVINVHFSELPKYRGASPVQSALISMENMTGVTILKSGIGMDDGDIIRVDRGFIEDNENAFDAFEWLSNMGARNIVPALDEIENGTATYLKQADFGIEPTYCKKLSPEMGNIDFGKGTLEIIGLIKGIAIWPTAHITIDDTYFKVYNARVYPYEVTVDANKSYTLVYDENEVNPEAVTFNGGEKYTNHFNLGHFVLPNELNLGNYKNGEVVVANSKQGLVLKCSDGFIEITELLPINGKKMTAKSYLNGKKINVGSIAK